MKTDLRSGTGYHDVWRIAWPIMISSLANTIINFTDTAFVSRIGETELAASAIGGVFYFVLVMTGMAIGIGAQIMISRKAGEDRPADIGVIFDHSVLLLTGLGIIMIVLVHLLMPAFIYKILDSREVAESAIIYVKARIWGLLFMMLLVASRCLFTGIGQTRIIGSTTVLMMVMNFILGYSLTFGHFGFPALGIRGVGYGSAIAEACAAVYAVAFSLLRSTLKTFRLYRFRTIRLSVFGNMLSLSAPIVLQQLLSMGSWFLFFVLIEKIGQHALAISNVVRSIYMVLMTPIWGYSQAANSMVSNIIGQKNNREVLPLTLRIIRMSAVTSFIIVLAVFLSPEMLLSLVTGDRMLMNDSMPSLYIVCIATLFFSISMIFLSAISGTGDTRAAMFIEVINIAAYLLFIYVCTQILHTTVEWVWVSEIQYWILMGVMSYLYLRSHKWENRIRKAE